MGEEPPMAPPPPLFAVGVFVFLDGNTLDTFEVLELRESTKPGDAWEYFIAGSAGSFWIIESRLTGGAAPPPPPPAPEPPGEWVMVGDLNNQPQNRQAFFTGLLTNNTQFDGTGRVEFRAFNARENVTDAKPFTVTVGRSLSLSLQVSWAAFTDPGEVRAVALLIGVGDTTQVIEFGIIGEVAEPPPPPPPEPTPEPEPEPEPQPLPKFRVGDFVILGGNQSVVYEVLQRAFAPLLGSIQTEGWQYRIIDTAGTGGAFWNQEANMTKVSAPVPEDPLGGVDPPPHDAVTVTTKDGTRFNLSAQQHARLLVRLAGTGKTAEDLTSSELLDAIRPP